MSQQEPQEYNSGSLWMLSEQDEFVLGITQSGIDQVGSLIELDLAEEGEDFEAGDWIGELRGKDFVLEIVAPFPLTLLERNQLVLEQASILEDDPTGDAWLLRVKKRNAG